MYIDLTTIQIFSDNQFNDDERRVSMSKMREAIDAYEAVGLPLGVEGILMTESQYYAYERTLYDFMQSYNKDSFSLPENLKFNGITLVIQK